MFKANVDSSSQQELLSCYFCYHVSPNTNKLWLLLCYLRVRFQLASPLRFHFNTHPEGERCTYIEMCFFHPSAFFSLPTAGLSSCSRLRGTRGARPDPISKFGSRPRSVARALWVERGHAGNTAVATAYSCGVKQGNRSSRTGIPADY